MKYLAMALENAALYTFTGFLVQYFDSWWPLLLIFAGYNIRDFAQNIDKRNVPGEVSDDRPS